MHHWPLHLISISEKTVMCLVILKPRVSNKEMLGVLLSEIRVRRRVGETDRGEDMGSQEKG